MELIAMSKRKNKALGMVWSAKCPFCSKEVVRLINNAKNDPYYRRSKATRANVRKYARDILQPNDPMFDIIYPHIKKEREEKLEAKERYEWEQRNKTKR